MRLAPFALAFVIALAAPLAAQDGPPSGDDKKADEKKDDRPPGSPGGMDQMPKTIARFLKDQVDLTEEQAAKVESILGDAFKDVMKRMVGRMGDEQPPSPEEGRKEMEDMRARIVGQIRDLLDEGQKKEFEVFVKEFETRARDWERESMSDPGRGAAFLFERLLPSKERTLVKVENALILNEEEKKAILPLAGKVWDARRKLVEDGRERRRDIDKAVHGGAKKEELREKIEVARARDAADREALEKAEAELRDVLTLEQEARLVALGILD
jgi:Spy/CpxP family protein refolding chaperone